jgi:serine/threonine-protein kinase
LLGRGGVGEVALAKDNDIERTVAVKRLLEPSDPAIVARFIDEVRVVGQLEHPNIIPVHDVGVDADGHYYFVMKHLEGETLEAIIERLRAGDRAAHARFSFATRAHLVVSVLNALAYAHQRGFIHRDLKPANVMVGLYGEVTIMDWGIAKRVHSGRTAVDVQVCADARSSSVRGAPARSTSPSPAPAATNPTMLGEVIGTPAYMAPEQARGDHAACDERTDLYSVGLILYELMHLRHPLEAHFSLPLTRLLDAAQTVAPALHDPSHANPHQPAFVPAEVDWLLKTALEKDPSRRFQTAEQMAARITRVFEGDFPVQCHRTFGKRVLRTGTQFIDRFPRLFIIGLTVAGAGLLGTLVNAVLSW